MAVVLLHQDENLEIIKIIGTQEEKKSLKLNYDEKIKYI